MPAAAPESRRRVCPCGCREDHRPRFLGAHARAGATQGARDPMDLGRHARAALRGRSFNAATVGFGVRNVDELEHALRELRRVLRPEGRLGILEITRPRGALAPFYRFWFDRVIPILGKLLPGGSAYTYLPASVRRFPGPEELANLIATAGFRDVRFRTFAGGIVALHTGTAH